MKTFLDSNERASPSDLKTKYPSHSFRTCSVAAIELTGASACIRAATPVEGPTGAYSVRPSPVVIDLTTTSPVFTPTRAWIGTRPSVRMRSE